MACCGLSVHTLQHFLQAEAKSAVRCARIATRTPQKTQAANFKGEGGSFHFVVGFFLLAHWFGIWGSRVLGQRLGMWVQGCEVFAR